MKPLLIALVLLVLATLAVVLSTGNEGPPVSRAGHTMDGWGK